MESRMHVLPKHNGRVPEILILHDDLTGKDENNRVLSPLSPPRLEPLQFDSTPPTSMTLNRSASKVLPFMSPYRMRNHAEIRAKLAIESKLDFKSPEEVVLENFRSPSRALYSRGHEIHAPGSAIPSRPIGSSPILSSGQTSRQRMDVSTSPIRPGVRERTPSTYSRLTTPNVLSCGQVSPATIGFVKGTFKHPLHTISCRSSSSLSSSVEDAALPPEADYIISSSKLASIATFSKQHLLEATPWEDRRFLSMHRSLPLSKAGGAPPPVAAAPPFKIDYSLKGSSDRKKRSICKQSLV